MRVVIDGRLILPNPTGIGRYLLELIPALAEAAAGESIEVWLQNRLPANHPAWQLARQASPEAAEISLHRLDYAHMSVSGWLKFPLNIRNHSFDLLHYPHFDLPIGIPGKVVVTLHDLKYLNRTDFFTHQPRLRRTLVRTIASATVRRADRVICVSNATAADAARLLPVDPAKLVVVHQGVSRRFFDRVQQDALEHFRRRYHLSEDFILFVGERRPHKNLTGLIRAYHLYQSWLPTPTHLLIVGKPYRSDRTPEQKVEELGLHDRVHFIDHVAEAELPALYQSASAFVLLSYYEGFGLPVLEAMASGIPVIAADRAALPEVCAGAARMVPPDDPEEVAQAISDVLSCPEERATLIESGRLRAQTFTWERCARETCSIYRSALA